MVKMWMFLLSMVVMVSCKEEIPPQTDAKLPSPDHVVIVFFENYSFHQIMDSTEAPFIQSIAYGKHSALFTNSNAFGHPSQPNYFEIFSGSNQGIINNDRPPASFTTPNLAYSLINNGYSFVTYSEGLPHTGFDGDINGLYVRKHNPVANWMGFGENQVDSSTNQPFTHFPENYDDLPTVCYIIPDLVNSMHDGSIKTGDDWLKTHFKDYINWAKRNNSLFILTFDESSYSSGTNLITTFITGRNVKQGIYDEYIDHHTILRTIEDVYKLPHAGNSINSTPLTNCWKFDF